MNACSISGLCIRTGRGDPHRMDSIQNEEYMKNKKECDVSLSEADLRAALVEMKTYVDVTEEDLKKIFDIAFRYAQERKATHMPVRDAMHRNVVTVTPDTDVHEAATRLSEHKISGMPVVDQEKRVVGVISQTDILVSAGLHREHTFRDILHRILREPVHAGKTGDKVKDVMSAPAITCKADDDLEIAAHTLDERNIKRLPIVDNNGKLVGILSRTDIVRLVGKKQRL
jgi:CBS domain-containing protein